MTFDPNQTIGSAPSFSSTTDTLLAEGMWIDEYLLKNRLGRGGMGEVWLADEMIHDAAGREKVLRQVVIKIVPRDVQNAPEEMERVCSSFDLVKEINHTHVCPLYGLKKHLSHGYYLVMKYVKGSTLGALRRKLLQSQEKITVDDVANYLLPAAEALDHAHAEKVIHRDVKPDNILVDQNGRTYVIDFGLAAQIRTSVTRISQVRMSTSGTLPYMAPEQWRGELQDAKTDQYSLGVVVYEFLSGKLPFLASDQMLLGFQVLQNPVPRLEDQSDHVNNVLARAMAKERNDRFASCIEMIKALQSLPPATVHFNRGKQHAEKEEWDLAILEFTQAIQCDANCADAYYRRGAAYYNKKDRDHAIADYTEVIRLRPNDADAYFQRGNVYINKKDYDRAIADCTETIRLMPDDDYAYFQRGWAYAEEGENDHAIANYTEAIRLNPYLADAYYSRGAAYYNKKDYDHAIADYTEVIRLNPHNDYAYYWRGWAYAEEGENDHAIADYTELIRLRPNDADAYENRACCYDKKGDDFRAEVDRKKAKELREKQK